MTLEVYKSALEWLSRGWSVIPLNPGTADRAAGFGPRVPPISDPSLVRAYFYQDDIRWNLAAIAPAGSFVLRFERWQLYCSWTKKVQAFNDCITRTYTELTPADGVHLFFRGVVSESFRPMPGVLVLSAVTVAPSETLPGLSYDVFCDNDIYSASLDAALYPLDLINHEAAALVPGAVSSTPIGQQNKKLAAVGVGGHV